MHVYVQLRAMEKSSSCSPRSHWSLYILQCFLKHLFTFSFWIPLHFLSRFGQILHWWKEGALPQHQRSHARFSRVGGWVHNGSPLLLVLMEPDIAALQHYWSTQTMLWAGGPHASKHGIATGAGAWCGKTGDNNLYWLQQRGQRHGGRAVGCCMAFCSAGATVWLLLAALGK